MLFGNALVMVAAALVNDGFVSILRTVLLDIAVTLRISEPPLLFALSLM